MGKRKIILFLLMLFFSLGSAVAQQKTITGKVVDRNGQPILGATVAVKGTTIGTISDDNGVYNLRIPNGSKSDTITVSFLGMQTAYMPVGNNTTINVTLIEDDVNVEEVVVTALGISKQRKAVGYSTAQVSGDELAEVKTSNPVTALAGKVAGVDIASNAGPGSSQNVMIRGAASFSENQPLYVVDGVPLINATPNYTGDNLNNKTDFGSGLNAVNPNDIEAMTVLKGAAATALYGSRAANGVVLITTKSGKNTSGKMTVTYDGSINIKRVGVIAKSQEIFGQGWSYNYATEENGNWGPKYTGLPQSWGFVVDNAQQVANFSYLKNRVRDFYELGLGNSHTISASGGNETTTYYFSVSNDNEDGVNPGDYDKYNRTTISTRGSHKWNALTVTSSLNFSNEKTSAVPTGQGAGAVTQDIWDNPNNISLVDLKDMDNVFNQNSNFYTLYGYNPYYILESNRAQMHRNKLYGKFQADYQIFKDLRFTYRFGGDLENTHLEAWRSIITFEKGSPQDINGGTTKPGYYYKQKRSRYEINNDAFLTYNKQLSEAWNINAVAGINIMETQANYIYGSLEELDIDGFYNFANGTADATTKESYTKKRMIGIFANVDLDWNRMVYLTLTARNDWSSTLPKKNNSYLYPGATLSWVFTELNSDSHIGPITFGKLRASYGWTGKDATAYYVYDIYSKANFVNPGYSGVNDFQFPAGGVSSWNLSNMMGNPDLKAELTNEYEFGLEFDLFNGLIGFDGDYYNKFTKNLIDQLSVDYSTGYTYTMANIGDIRNQGYELSVYGYPVKKDNFKWKLTVNFSQNFNKVERLDLSEVGLSGFKGCEIFAVEGKAIGQFKSNVAERIKHDGKEYVVVSETGRPAKSANTVFLDKDVNEKFRAGLTSRWEYKNFSLSATFDLHYGGYFYSKTKAYLGWTGAGYETTQNDRNPFIIPNSVIACSKDDKGAFKVTNISNDGEEQVSYYKENTTPMGFGEYSYYYSEGEDYDNTFVIDRSYLKLRNVTFSYTLPKNLVSKLKLQDIRVSATAGNILLWTPKENCYVDPENSTFDSGIKAKFGEWMTNPSNQVYTLGLSVKF